MTCPLAASPCGGPGSQPAERPGAPGHVISLRVTDDYDLHIAGAAAPLTRASEQLVPVPTVSVPGVEGELPHVFRTGNSRLIYATAFIPKNSSMTSRGVL